MHNNRARFHVCAGLLGIALLLPRLAVAAWPTEPSVNVPICTASGDQGPSRIVSDGTGGTLVAWQDYRNGNWDIYAQRISADGVVQWAANGVPLCIATGHQTLPTIVPDGTGGAIVTWQDKRGGLNLDIYAQRINAAGACQWTYNGVALCTATGEQSRPTIVSDGASGAVVTWQDYRSGAGDIYAQRVSAVGEVEWAANGEALCTATYDQEVPTIVSDGGGGAIVTWMDDRSGNRDIFVQRISAAGEAKWAANGVPLCTATYDQEVPTIVSDGGGGAIVAWHDCRDGSYGTADIYAQRISAAGEVQWVANGVALCTATGSQMYPTMVSDGAGGAIVAWWYFLGYTADIYAQRISAAGTVMWADSGATLCTTHTSGQAFPAIVSDGVGGAIVAWHDEGVDGSGIYAQRISAAGTVQWTANGVALSTPAAPKDHPAIVPDGAGGAVVTWRDGRNDAGDIYAQGVKENGELGSVLNVPRSTPLSFALDAVRPNPCRGGALTVHFSLPTNAPARLELLDVAGRRVVAREVGSHGPGRHALDLGEGLRLAPGLYLVRLRQGADARVTRASVLR